MTRLFYPKLYQYFVSEREGGNKQRTAFVVRRNLSVKRLPDLRELNTTSGLRHGIDIEVNTGQHSIRLLGVHLKSFCFDDPLPKPDIEGNHCERLASQVPVLEKWIDERVTTQTPFIVLGDFNRRFDYRQDDFWLELDDGEPADLTLFRATSGRESHCWGGEYLKYIDHILYDGQINEWIVPGSFEQLLYGESKSMKALLSDHCPIGVTLKIP